MSFQDFSLAPANDPITPADDLAAAAQAALAAPAGVQPATPEPQEPLGRTWDFDWVGGQFRRVGQSPANLVGLDAVAQWAQMAIHTARYAHPVVSDDFGMEQPDRVIGELATPGVIADWKAALVEALLVHDRITAVENIVLDWDPTQGILTVRGMDIVTDTEQVVTVSDVTMKAGGQ